MAGWSMLNDGCGLDCFKIIRDLQKNGYCLDVNIDDDDDNSSTKVISLDNDNISKDSKLRYWFHQILSVYLKEISLYKIFRPLPAMLGDGQFVDLFRLFCVVREKGGYDLVSKNGLWGSVANESGFCSEVASCMKLFYVKYLYTLDKWVSQICKEKGIDAKFDLINSIENLCSVLVGLEIDSMFKDFLRKVSDHRKMFVETDMVYPKWNEFQVSYIGKTETICVNDDREEGKEEELESLNPSNVDENSTSRKRKRETLSEMLDWLRKMGKGRKAPTASKKLAEVPKENLCGDMDFKDMVLLARKVLFQRADGFVQEENSHSQIEGINIQIASKSNQRKKDDSKVASKKKKQKINPSNYEDQVTERVRKTVHESSITSQINLPRKDQVAEIDSAEVRSSKRLRKTVEINTSESSSSSQINLRTCLTPSKAGRQNPSSKKLVAIADLISADTLDPLDENQREKHVPIGSQFQAEVPEWTGVPSESDSKWLGTRRWPLTAETSNSLSGINLIGKGREDSCCCTIPGSVECVRFHIAEKRMTLKLELGLVFYYWRFQFMGEGVSLSWTKTEENKFKEIVKLNPRSLAKCFWDEALRCFHDKKRTSLVSYYFNVFLLRRRCYQNRVTPDNIDSDDDESEFGYESEGNVLDSESTICPTNTQFICF